MFLDDTLFVWSSFSATETVAEAVAVIFLCYFCRGRGRGSSCIIFLHHSAIFLHHFCPNVLYLPKSLVNARSWIVNASLHLHAVVNSHWFCWLCKNFEVNHFAVYLIDFTSSIELLCLWALVFFFCFSSFCDQVGSLYDWIGPFKNGEFDCHTFKKWVVRWNMNSN